MPYDLPQLARFAHVRPGVYVIDTPPPPATIRLELQIIVMRPVRAWQRAFRETVLPLYAAAQAAGSPPALDAVLYTLNEAQAQLLQTLEPEVQEWTARLEHWHRRQFLMSAKRATGLELQLHATGAGSAELTQAAQARILSLISGLSDATRGRLTDAVWAAHGEQMPPDLLAARLRAGLELPAARGALIARDQTLTQAALLDRLRQEEAGLRVYRWRSGEERTPRGVHAARDGREFAWDNPPEDGHPGTLIQCGCKARGLLHLEAR